MRDKRNNADDHAFKFLYRDNKNADWDEMLAIRKDGVLNVKKIGIGISNPNYELDVNGTIHARKVIVNTNFVLDFVFKDDYYLPTLKEVEDYIDKNGHLPDIPSEAEALKNGVSLGDMQMKLLQKIEELTLYVIALDEENNRLKELIKNN